MRFFKTCLIAMLISANGTALAANLQCLEKLEEKICILGKNEVCNYGDNDRYAQVLRDELEKLPTLFGQLACRLKTIEVGIRPDVIGQYFSNEYRIFLSEFLFEEDANLDIELDIQANGFFNSDVIVHYVNSPSVSKPNAMIYILAHELAHFLESEYLIGHPFQCLPPQSARNSLSLSRRCVYGCDDKLDAVAVKQQYELLRQSPYLTFYSLSTPKEDFAELFSFRVLLKRLHITPTIKGYYIYNYDTEINSNRLAPKVKTIDRLLQFPIDDPDAAREEALAHLTCDKNYQFQEKPAQR